MADLGLIIYIQLKRKFEHEDNEVAESSEWATSTGYSEAVISPLQTPVSGKGNRPYGGSKATTSNKSGPRTPISTGLRFSFSIVLLYIHTWDFLE